MTLEEKIAALAAIAYGIGSPRISRELDEVKQLIQEEKAALLDRLVMEIDKRIVHHNVIIEKADHAIMMATTNDDFTDEKASNMIVRNMAAVASLEHTKEQIEKER